ncbi:MAG TPA: calcium/sodium antiporter [Thermodesulfobacteriota bacterium]|nr:calcium/sodium antiporter [Thermodesulfobacteriota bacterium]
MIIFFLILGLIFLIAGAELLVKGSSRLASSFGISPFLVGLTVVAFGTSSPELAVSVKAALSNQASIGLGNIIGSNIFNILFIIGISAIIRQLFVTKQLLKQEVPLIIFVSGLVLIFALDGNFNRLEGLLLLAGFAIYMIFLVRQSRIEQAKPGDDFKTEFTLREDTIVSIPRNTLFIILGLGLLVLGSKWFVNSAVSIAEYFEVSKIVIGLTIVAAGTSLPEVVTSVLATIKGERDIAVGNIIGSNLFNIMAVLGLSSLVAPVGIQIAPSVIGFDIPIMIIISIICFPIFYTDSLMSRLEGGLFLGCYIAYISYIVFISSNNLTLPLLNNMMLYILVAVCFLIFIGVIIKPFINLFKK